MRINGKNDSHELRELHEEEKIRATLNAQRWGCDVGATARAASVSASGIPSGGDIETQDGNRPENFKLQISNYKLNNTKEEEAKEEKTKEEEHGQDARETHGRDAHATKSNNKKEETKKEDRGQDVRGTRGRDARDTNNAHATNNAMIVLLVLLCCISWAGAQSRPLPSVASPAASTSVKVIPATSTAPAVSSTQPADVSFPVSKFIFSYARSNPNLPPLEKLDDITLSLAKSPAGLSAPQPSQATTTFRLGETLPVALQFQGSAIRRINAAVVEYFNKQGFVGILVTPADDDIDPQTLKDLRPPGQTAMHLIIRAGRVTNVTTSAPAGGATSKPAAQSPSTVRLLEYSPIKPATAEAPQNVNLLRKDMIDDYVSLLNRMPGRRVDAVVQPAGDGDVALNYLVSQEKTPIVYAQGSNTGPENTPSWRERFGMIVNQATNNDDTFTVDYITANFDSENAVMASYEAPLGRGHRLRWRTYGSWAKYSAADIGIQTENFSGTDAQVGGELIWNFYQHHQLFVDAIGGVYGRFVTAHGEVFDTTGQAGLLLPYIGLRAERITENSGFWGMATLEGNTTGISQENRDNLGRYDTDQRWIDIKWNGGATFFLEPLINAQQWASPAQSAKLTRAHEIALLTHGQYAGNYRLIPQVQDIAGGLYSVRGYPTAVAVGDTTIVGTAEYRWHIPRAFDVQPQASQLPLFNRPFRFAPAAPLGRPDWDLIAKTFFDIGRTINNDPLLGEQNQTLMGWGVGLELKIRQNFSISCDWGMALKDANYGEVTAGSNRFYIVATFSW